MSDQFAIDLATFAEFSVRLPMVSSVFSCQTLGQVLSITHSMAILRLYHRDYNFFFCHFLPRPVKGLLRGLASQHPALEAPEEKDPKK